MNRVNRIVKGSVGFLLRTALFALIFVALLIAVVRLSFLQLSNFREQIETFFSTQFNVELSIGSIEGDWQYFDPIVRVTDLKLSIPHASEVRSISLGNGEVRLNGLSTLFNQTLIFSRFFADRWDLNLALNTTGADQFQLDLEQLVSMLSAVELMNVRGGRVVLIVDGKRYEFLDSSLLRMETRYRQKIQLAFRPAQHYLSVSSNESLVSENSPDSKTTSDLFRFIFDLRNSYELNGRGYIELPHTDFSLNHIPWLEAKTVASPIKAGTLSARLWLDIDGGAVNELKSNIRFANLESQFGTAPPVTFSHLNLNLHWQTLDGAGIDIVPFPNQQTDPFLSRRSSVLGINGIEFNIAGDQWELSPWLVNIEQSKDRYSITADGGALAIEPFTPLIQRVLGIGHPLSKAMMQMNLSGVLNSPRIEVSLNPDQPAKYGILSALENITINAWRGVPSVGLLSGYIAFNGTTGILSIDSEPFNLHFPELFDNNWHYRKAAGEIIWSIETWGVLVASDLISLESEHVNGTGKFHIQLPFNEQELELSLLVGLHNSSLKAKSDYLSNRPEIEGLMGWLDRSLISGSIEQGGVLYQGSIKKGAKPDSRNLQLVFDLHSAELTYDPQWPGLRELNATLWVNDDNLLIESSSLKTDEIVLGGVAVTGQLMKDEYRLKISTEFRDSGENALAYLRKTPIVDLNPELFEQLDISGELSIGLALQIPITDGSVDVEYEVDLQTHNNDMQLPDYSLAFKQVSGQVNFSSSTGIRSEQFTASFLEEPVVGSISTILVNEKPSITSIQLKGASKLQAITPWYEISQLSLLSGKFEYRATLDLYYDKPAAPLLQVFSDLVGVSSKYPEPLAKEIDQNRDFRFSMELSELPIRLNFGLDRDINLSLEIALNQPLRGRLLLGEGVANQVQFDPIEQDGFTVKGILKAIDLEPWFELFTESGLVKRSEILQDPSAQHKGEIDFPIDGVDLDIKNLRYGDYQFGQVTVGLSQDEEGVLFNYQFNLSSGKVRWDFDPAKPLNVDILYLQLNTEKKSAEQKDPKRERWSLEHIDPTRFPAIDFSVGNILMNGRDTGAWKWKLRSDTEGAHIFEGYIKSDDLEVKDARVDWLVSGQKDTTALQLDGSFRDVSKVMSTFGFSPILSSDEGVVGIKLNSKGRPDQLSVASTNGEISFISKKGRFLAGDAGASFDILDVLNIDAILGSLFSNFAGLGGESMKYRRIGGDVVLENNVIRIKEVIKVEGVSANFELSGLYYLEKDQLDMSLIVTLPVSKNLPWYGVLVGGLPAAVAVFIASKIFEDPLKVFSSARYRITGTIDNPKVELDSVFETETNSKIMELYEKSNQAVQSSSDPDEQQQPTQ